MQECLEFDSTSEREIYEETLQALKDEGRMSQEEMTLQANKVLKDSRKYEDTSF